MSESALSVRVKAAAEGLHLPKNNRLAAKKWGVPAEVREAAVFLDRDGVLIEDVHFLTGTERLRLLPGVIGALRLLQERFFIIVATNQSGIARGLLSEDDLLTIHSELVRLLGADGAIIDAFYYCPHLPEGSVAAYAGECDCRKPKPGMLRRAKDDWGIDLAGSFMVGDKPRDVEAGLKAGATAVLLGSGEAAPDQALEAVDLTAAAGLILARADARP